MAEEQKPIQVAASEDAWLDEQVRRSVWVGPLNKVVDFVDLIYNWGRRNSVWPLGFGLACCAIEFICTQSSRFDMSRFGMEVTRPSPITSTLPSLSELLS